MILLSCRVFGGGVTREAGTVFELRFRIFCQIFLKMFVILFI